MTRSSKVTADARYRHARKVYERRRGRPSNRQRGGRRAPVRKRVSYLAGRRTGHDHVRPVSELGAFGQPEWERQSPTLASSAPGFDVTPPVPRPSRCSTPSDSPIRLPRAQIIPCVRPHPFDVFVYASDVDSASTPFLCYFHRRQRRRSRCVWEGTFYASLCR